MSQPNQETFKIITDLEKLNATNAEGCAACGKKFSLGDTAVWAVGDWDGGPRLVHENEATFDPALSLYFIGR